MGPNGNMVETTDVLIIGAGPAGLMCASALGGLGVRTIIIDRREPGELYGQADGIQPGTAEIWQSYGLRERLMKEGWPLTALAAYMANLETEHIERQPLVPNISVADARYPYEVIIPIEGMEGILKDSAAKYDVHVEQPYVPTALEIDEAEDVHDLVSYPVKVTLARPEGKGEIEKRVIHAKYIVGCDGARSWVRETMGIKMERDGEDRPINWGVLDFTPTGTFPDTRIKCVITSPVCGMIGLIPKPGGIARLYVPLEPEHWEKRKFTREELVASVQNTVNKVFKPYEMNITNCTWASTYKVVQQVASSYSVQNRVFIAGDACHTHSPKAGQGANASMRDTHNLAWKIAYVLRGWAKPSLLSTYDTERRACARELIALDRHVAKAFELGGSEGKYKRIWEDKNRFLSGIGILYHSPLTPVEEPSPLAPGLIPGECLPPSSVLRLNDWHSLNVQDLIISDGSFKLLIFPGTLSAAQNPEGLATFAEKVLSGIADVKGTVTGDGQRERVLLRLYVVLAGPKEGLHWTDVPNVVRDAELVHVENSVVPMNLEVPDVGGKKTYMQYGIDPAVGAAVLIRPDAHISLVTSADTHGAERVEAFLRSL